MKKLDKKQIPQFIALCVVTAGLSGYLVMHFVTPGPVAAGTRPVAANAKPGETKLSDTKPSDLKPGDAKPGDLKPGDPQSADSTDAPPPSPTMHDPFAVGYVDPATLPAPPPAASNLPPAPALPKLPGSPRQTASTGGVGAMPINFPAAPALPGGLSSFPVRPGGMAPGLPAAPAFPAAPAAPIWTVTGVLQGATGKVAILRSGEARRIVHSGDFVDSTYRVTGVTRTSVILRHGTVYYQLVLGGAKPSSAKPDTAPVMPLPGTLPLPASLPAPASSSAAQPLTAPQQAAIIPVYHMARPQMQLTHLKQQGAGLNLASEPLSVPRPAGPVSGHSASLARSASPTRIASAISLGLRLLDGTVPVQGHKGR